VDRDALLGLMQGSIAALAVELGLLVASAMLEDEVNRLCGTRYQRQPGRSHTRYGHQRGVVMLGGQELPIERPRVRRADGGGGNLKAHVSEKHWPELVRRLSEAYQQTDYAAAKA
jgi:hypothetical protein